VVIVNDPARPPTQDNIKQIVEMKFPPDKLTEVQEDAYKRIAGDRKKLQVLEPRHCNCDAPEPDAAKVPLDKLGWAAAVAAWITFALSRGRAPRPSLPAF
jgi:hypothetical protein